MDDKKSLEVGYLAEVVGRGMKQPAKLMQAFREELGWVGSLEITEHLKSMSVAALAGFHSVREARLTVTQVDRWEGVHLLLWEAPLVEEVLIDSTAG
jgi:hypothetical protein